MSYVSHGCSGFGHYNNIHDLSGITISNSSGGTYRPINYISQGAPYGGTAGSISFSYYARCGKIENNVHTLNNISIRDSFGGVNSSIGAAGSIAVSYRSGGFQPLGLFLICNNTHSMTNLSIFNTSGGINTLYGGAAGAISISYYADRGMNCNNSHTFSDITIAHASGGDITRFGGAAGSLSVSYWSSKAPSDGTGATNINNSHLLTNVHVSQSIGGSNTQDGGSSGGISFSYYGEKNINNTHKIFNATLQNCNGGDRTQGAGALAVQTLGATSGTEVSIQESLFEDNIGAIFAIGDHSPAIGAAGAVRIYVKASGPSTPNSAIVANTTFRSNVLDSTCTSGLCMAGAVAFSIPTTLDGGVFDSNTCRRSAGGIYSDSTLTLQNCVFSDNNATQVSFGTGNVLQVSAQNTTMHFSGPNGGLVFDNLSAYNQLLMKCPAGHQTDNTTAGQITCERCPGL